MVLTFFNSFQIPEDINKTYITLISKTKNLEKIQNYRPISLCNISYKLM